MTTDAVARPGLDATIPELLEKFRAKWGKVKLDVGCGAEPRGEDFITVDRYVGSPVHVRRLVKQDDGTMAEVVAPEPLTADIQADMWDIPVPDASIDEIWCSHALEHVPMRQVPAALKEFLRILKPGARAIIQVPNFDYVARYWLTGGDRPWAEQMVFGLQDHEGEFHKAAWNSLLLRGDCEGVGFEVLRIEMRWTHNQETLQAVCKKPA